MTNELSTQETESSKPLGRRRLSANLCKTVCLCMTPSLIEKMRALGGSKWVRKIVAEADVASDRLKEGHKRWSPDVYVQRQCVTMPEEYRNKLRELGGSPWVRQRVIDSDVDRDGV